LGHGVMKGLELLVGKLAYLTPVALVLGGVRVLARDLELAPATRPLRSGTICLLLALALAFAAGVFGPGQTPSNGFWSGAVIEPRGGLLGGIEFYVAGHLLSTAGADILAVFLLLAGVILLSGATFASVINNSRRHASALRRGPEVRSATRRAEIRAARLRRRQDDDDDPMVVPEPRDTELIVRATHVEAPPIDVYEDADGQRSFAAGEDPLDEDGLAPAEPAEFDDFVHFDGSATSETAEMDAVDYEAEADDPEDEAETSAGPQRDVDPSELTPAGRYRASVTEDPEFVWRVPSPRFLVRSTGEAAKPDTTGQAATAKALVEALGHFGIESKVVGQVSGPHITRYEIKLAPGTKMSKVSNLKDDLAYALAAVDVRILAPIPGKTAVGVEVPNQRRRIVHLGDVFQEPPAEWSPLSVWLGKDIAGRAIGADLAKMPHLLVAGTTGAGKSACVNAMLSSILLRATPHEVRLVLVDPKQVELNHYESIPHLLTPVITSPKMAANALQNLVREMEQRYGTMRLARTRSLPELNKARAARGEPPLPYILCVIDELADLMMVAPADVEDSIIR
ncbi:MAG: DNA translocase FtsK, partial [Acidobacteriota bacterium]|nr:DNA translocase FtsK [Acidobacteriota bacterium]